MVSKEKTGLVSELLAVKLNKLLAGIQVAIAYLDYVANAVLSLEKTVLVWSAYSDRVIPANHTIMGKLALS